MFVTERRKLQLDSGPRMKRVHSIASTSSPREQFASENSDEEHADEMNCTNVGDSDDHEATEHPAKRACHEIKVKPVSNHVADDFLRIVSETQRLLIENGYSEMKHPPIESVERMASIGNGKSCPTPVEQALIRISRNKTKRAQNSYNTPSYFGSRGMSLQVAISSILSNHANNAAFSTKGRKTQSASQQTTRFQTGGISPAQFSQQVTTAMVLGLSPAFCNAEGVLTSDPQTSFRMDYSHFERVASLPAGSMFVHVAGSSFFCEDMPRCVASSNVVENMKHIAADELSMSVISLVMRPRTHHIKLTCERLVGNCHGYTIWFAWALLNYLYRDARARHILCEYGITEFDVAVASSMLEYGRGSVSNKVRRDEPSARELELLNRLMDTGAVSRVDDAWNPQQSCMASIPSDSSFQDVSVAMKCQRSRVLSKKCRRAPASRITGEYDENACAMIEFVHCAWLARNPFMRLLATELVSLCEDAARKTLEWQLAAIDLDYKTVVDGSPANSIARRVLSLSERAARNIQAAVMDVCMQPAQCSPVIVRWKNVFESTTRVGIARSYAAFGLANPFEDRNDKDTAVGNERPCARVIMVCQTPPEVVRPSAQTSWISWVDATQSTKRSTAYKHPVCGLTEAIKHINLYNMSSEYQTAGPAIRERVLSGRRAHIESLSEVAMPMSISGMTRSVLGFKLRAIVNPAVLEAAQKLGRRMQVFATASASSTLQRESKVPRGTSPSIQPESIAVLECSDAKDPLHMPATTPSSPIAVGLLFQESFRTMMSLMSQKHFSMTSMRTCVDTAAESRGALSNSTDLSNVPTALLAVQDFEFAPIQGATPIPRAIGPAGSLCDEVQASMTITVAGDCVVPLCKAIDMLLATQVDAQAVRNVRALILFGLNQCITFGAYSQSASETESGTSIMRTSKITDPDNNRAGFFTLSQVYVSGNANVHRLFCTSAWCGVYGASYATGAIASPGRNCTNIVSDRRLTASLYTNQEQVDSMTHRAAQTMFVRDSSTLKFAKIPYELRGIPRNVIPGVHTICNSLHDSFEQVRSITGTSDRDTVMSLQVLPLSPWSEAVPALCSEPSWFDYRKRTSGLFPKLHSHRPDATPKELSILKDKFFDGGRLRMTTDTDNIFETIYENMQSCFAVASAVGHIARTVHCIATAHQPNYELREALQSLRVTGNAFFELGASPKPYPLQAALFCDACVLVTMMYPGEFEIGNTLVPKFHEKSSRACLSGECSTAASVARRAGSNLSPDDVSKAKHAWMRLSAEQNSAWEAFCDFVCAATLESDVFDLTLERRAEISRIAARFVRSAWYTHSADGTTPPNEAFPTHGKASPAHITVQDALEVYVDRPEALQPNRRRQRGGIVGVKTGAVQQLTTLLAAAAMRGSGAEKVRVQHALNEGGMLKRLSSCAIVATGRKGASPVGSENDELAFGTFENKKKAARLQMKAWLFNNEVIFEATRHLVMPKYQNTAQMRGDAVEYTKRRHLKATWDAQMPRMISTEEKRANMALMEAVLRSA